MLPTPKHAVLLLATLSHTDTLNEEAGVMTVPQFVSVTLLEVTWRAKEKGGTLEMGRDHWLGDTGAGLQRGCLQVVGLE